MKFGYARVSTRDQNPDLQVDQLRQAGCERIVQEITSGAKSDRPVLGSLLEQMHAGDILVIWKLDRLSRSLRDLVDLVGSPAASAQKFTLAYLTHIDPRVSSPGLLRQISPSGSANSQPRGGMASCRQHATASQSRCAVVA